MAAIISPINPYSIRTRNSNVISYGRLTNRGVVTKFCLGGGDGFIGTQINLPPKFGSSSDFGHFILKMVENAEFLSGWRKKDANISSFLGGRPPLIFRLRGTRPPVPSAFDAHVDKFTLLPRPLLNSIMGAKWPLSSTRPKTLKKTNKQATNNNSILLTFSASQRQKLC